MRALSYDLHVHPGPSAATRWGDGRRVAAAAAASGVRGFVWKAHERHTVELCRELGSLPVRAIPSASLNPWARLADTLSAIHAGALWVWGPTTTPDGLIAWDLPLPRWWPGLAERLTELRRPVVLATGHLGPEGRRAFSELAARSAHLCSITHSLYVPVDEALAHAEAGCALEIDAYTYRFPLPGRRMNDAGSFVERLLDAAALVYFTSDGGQADTGDPFVFGARTLHELEAAIGGDGVQLLGVDNPAAMVAAVDRERVTT
jgi:hypothetical protein